MLAEDHVEGASVGELLGAMLVEQFDRLMHGGKFFFANGPDLTRANLRGIIDVDSMRLSDVIRRTTNVNFPQGTNVFFANPDY